MRSGAASLRRLRSWRANFRSTDNQDGGSSGVERETLMSANELRTRGNSHLITCPSHSNGRQCTHDYCVSNSKIAVSSVQFFCAASVSLCLFYLSLCELCLRARGLIILLMSHSFTGLRFCVYVYVCMCLY